MNTIGARIGQLRSEKGITQSALATALGVKRETVHQWESNTRDLKTEAIIKLAGYFEVSCDWLLGVSDVRSRDIDARIAHEKYGLSETALERLAKWWTGARFHIGKLFPKFHVLNCLLESNELNSLLNALMRYCGCAYPYTPSYENLTGEDLINAESVIETTGGVVFTRPEAQNAFLYEANLAVVEIAKEISQRPFEGRLVSEDQIREMRL